MSVKKNNLSQIRQNINRRKKAKTSMNKAKERMWQKKQVNPFFAINDEERHGYEPSYYPPIKKKEDRSYFFKGLLGKSVIAAAIFFVATLTVSSQHPLLKQPKTWTTYAMTEEFPFATVNAWYQAKFGAPFAIQTGTDIQETSKPVALPVAGKITENFQENGEGVLIASDQETEVAAIEGGTVLFAGNSRETGKTVIIQHSDRSKSIYGGLSSLEVYSYQTIHANQAIGSYKPETPEDAMYFAIEKNREFVDPIPVIKVDEPS